MLPSDLYNDKLSKGDWEHNPAQADLIKILDTFHKKLNKKWVWKSVFYHSSFKLSHLRIAIKINLLSLSKR